MRGFRVPEEAGAGVEEGPVVIAGELGQQELMTTLEIYQGCPGSLVSFRLEQAINKRNGDILKPRSRRQGEMLGSGRQLQ